MAGLGDGGDGYAYVFDDANSGYGPLSGGWINLGWGSYGAANGATHPAVGNVDVDPEEEIVLGTGAGGDRYLRVFDTTGGGYTPGLWIQAGDTGAIAASQHEVWPAVCDGLLVLGASSATGTGGDGWLNTRLSTGAVFGSGWFQLPWGAYNGAVGSTYPSCGDIDGDGKQEIAVGLGS